MTKEIPSELRPVVLLQPPFLPNYSHSSRSPAVARSGTLYFPLWLAYGAVGLADADVPALLLDPVARGWSREETLERLRALSPRLVVVDIAAPSRDNDLAFASAAAEFAPVAVGGVAVANDPGFFAEKIPSASRILSDYDEALPALVGLFAGGGGPFEISRLAERLDTKNFVSEIYRRDLRIRDYFYACARHPFVAVLAGRGCPFLCGFCSWPRTLSGSRPRSRSAAHIAREMLHVERNLPEVREIFFEDDTFNISEEVVAERCEAMIWARTRTPWSVNLRPRVSREILALMKRAGCRLLLAGYESGDEKLLRLAGKGATLDDIHRFSEDARALGLLVHGCFILGLPGETPESIEKTVRLSLSLAPDTAQFLPYMNGAGDTGVFGNGRHMASGSEFSPEILSAHCDAARRRFYLRPRYLARKAWQSLVSPAEFTRNIRGFRNLAGSLFSS